MKMTLADVAHDRSVPGRSAGLFLTDRCPVGCGHCSVDSRPDSPTVEDYDLLAEIVHALCDRPGLRSVGITGGEPFIERRALAYAVNELTDAGKAVVLFTSGVWARHRAPAWVRDVLRRSACVFLSTDAFHGAAISDDAFVCAARTIAEEAGGLVVQVLNTTDMVDAAVRLLETALGAEWQEHAELSRVRPLPYGRGAALFAIAEAQPATSFGCCRLVETPLVRYDGIVSACCNEQVIAGHGPDRLRQRCATAAEINSAIDGFLNDPVLRTLGNLGAGALTLHPAYQHLQGRSFSSLCELCWSLQASSPSADSDGLLNAMALLQPVGGS